jgi:hypothetical protein
MTNNNYLSGHILAYREQNEHLPKAKEKPIRIILLFAANCSVYMVITASRFAAIAVSESSPTSDCS